MISHAQLRLDGIASSPSFEPTSVIGVGHSLVTRANQDLPIMAAAAAAAAEQAVPASTSTSLYEQLDSYDWDADGEFQSGLAAILQVQAGSTTSTEQREELTLRARCFYFAR